MDALKSTKLATSGGPAFPIDLGAIDGCQTTWLGMTLRDYFAAQALVANKGWTAGTADDAARDAYTVADALLKARGEASHETE